MKEITLKIPDKKIEFFLKLVEELGFEVSQEVDIPDEYKAIVRERIQKSVQEPERLLDWEKVKDDFKLD